MQIILNKHRLEALCVLAVVLVVALTTFSVAYARTSSGTGDSVVRQAEAEDNFSFHFLLAANTAPTSTILADLSDAYNGTNAATRFKHTASSGLMEVSQLRIGVNSNVNSTTTLQLGLIASTTANGDLADVFWFDTVTLHTDAATKTHDSLTLDYAPSTMKLGRENGVPRYFTTTQKDMVTTAFATTSPLLASDGTYAAPAAGDLVMRVYDQKGTATTTVTGLYTVR